MSNANHNYGRQSETAAVAHLRRLGYAILHRNYRTPYGEIDIVAEHKGVTVFIEVKARKSMRYGSPRFAVTTEKQRKISMVALAYLKKHRALDIPARFDVVTVQQTGHAPAIDVIPNAFDLAYG
jgi:putative endonuclease